jgi:hypothetical protein
MRCFFSSFGKDLIEVLLLSILHVLLGCLFMMPLMKSPCCRVTCDVVRVSAISIIFCAAFVNNIYI